MSRRACCWTLWIAFAFLAPLPLYLVEPAVVPVARMLQLAAVILALVVTEGALGVAGTLLWMLLVQAFLYLVLLRLAAVVLSRLLARGSRRLVAAGTILLLVSTLAAAWSFEIYHTPFRTRSLQASLFEVFE
jgi:hypothetical protein